MKRHENLENSKNWLIPAKTFLVGEYVALSDGPAIILTTSPCFKTGISDTALSTEINIASPAGLWWSFCQSKKSDELSRHLTWHDPYQGIGGFGASSAQFLGAFLASCQMNQEPATLDALLEAYFQVAWRGEGMKPSGYDVIAQTQQQCVFIHRKEQVLETKPWPFTDVGFLLLHTGKKLATHDHLRNPSFTSNSVSLSAVVETAWRAFQDVDSYSLIAAVNDYQTQLMALNLMASHSITLIMQLKRQFRILAAKGCGAMGADILLLIVDINQFDDLNNNLSESGWSVLASHADLYCEMPIF